MNLSVEIRIASYLGTDSRFWPVAGKDFHVVGELTEHAQTLDNHEHGSSIEIRSTDGAFEQRVTRERHLLCLAIEGEASPRMTRGLKNSECVTAKSDGVASIQTLPCIGEVVSRERVDATNALGLFRQRLKERLVGGADLRTQSPVVKDKLVTEVMVHVSVRDKQVLGC